MTNPPLDAIREALVTSLGTTVGAEQDLFKETPAHCRHLRLPGPVLEDDVLERIRKNPLEGLKARTLTAVFPAESGGDGLAGAMADLYRNAGDAVAEGATLLIISDRSWSREMAPIPALLATAGVHHHLIREGSRTRCGLIVETGEAREIHHLCCLIGYGAGAVNPYLALSSAASMAEEGILEAIDPATARRRFIKAAEKGILKVMSKMGISTLQSYRGAQIFEAVGISPSVIDAYFTGTSSRIGGADIERIAADAARRHRSAFPDRVIPSAEALPAGGKYQWRRNGETHQYSPSVSPSFSRRSVPSTKGHGGSTRRPSTTIIGAGGSSEGFWALAPADRPYPWMMSSPGRPLSSDSRPEPCPTAPSAKRPMKPWPSP